MLTAIQNTDIILSRSGYSTVMDLASLGKKAIFIPTPGQTEQEYLASISQKWGFGFRKQADLKSIKTMEDWESCFKSNKHLSFSYQEEESQSGKLLASVVRDFLKTINQTE